MYTGTDGGTLRPPARRSMWCGGEMTTVLCAGGNGGSKSGQYVATGGTNRSVMGRPFSPIPRPVHTQSQSLSHPPLM
uniref:Uncharacterized protein n=1 Tax=Oryza sativa subsp. japonica TaxID=39947 RepID=Q94HY5_ORYSJ|nr:hypothetical protein [Oryza sativa Japonica Group]